MKYEKTGKKVNKDTGNNAKDYTLKQVSTGTILWHVVKRHKFALVTLYAAILTILYLFPFAPDLLFSMI